MLNIIKYINLNNYSESSGYMGFFENAIIHSESNVEVIANSFLDYFISKGINLGVTSSLFIDSDIGYVAKNYNISRKEYCNIIDPLVKNGWVSLVDYKNLGDDYNSKEYENSLLSLEHAFISSNKSKEFLSLTNRLCQLIMRVGGVNGHFFFLLEDGNLAIYPHEDLGFGLICKNNATGCAVGEEYLSLKAKEQVQTQHTFIRGQVKGDKATAVPLKKG